MILHNAVKILEVDGPIKIRSTLCQLLWDLQELIWERGTEQLIVIAWTDSLLTGICKCPQLLVDQSFMVPMPPHWSTMVAWHCDGPTLCWLHFLVLWTNSWPEATYRGRIYFGSWSKREMATAARKTYHVSGYAWLRFLTVSQEAVKSESTNSIASLLCPL